VFYLANQTSEKYVKYQHNDTMVWKNNIRLSIYCRKFLFLKHSLRNVARIRIFISDLVFINNSNLIAVVVHVIVGIPYVILVW